MSPKVTTSASAPRANAETSIAAVPISKGTTGTSNPLVANARRSSHAP